jgi:CRP/FNR family transcriptional regulator, anaerobic regulatory protein
MLRSEVHSLWPQSPVDDGDAARFCSTCVFGKLCMPDGYSKHALGELHMLIEHVGPFHAGDPVFAPGEAFNAVYSVRAGVVKTWLLDDKGREQVLGFYTPGELVGLNAIYSSRYPCHATAVDTVMLCRFSFPAMATMAAKIPSIQQTLFQLISKDIGTATLGKGDFSAEERLAAFLVNWSERLASRGYAQNQFQLPMQRTDIANYLTMAPETLSRVIRRLSDEGLVSIERREVEVHDRKALEQMAASILRRG